MSGAKAPAQPRDIVIMTDFPDDPLDDLPALFRNAPSSVSFKKLRKRLLRQVRETITANAMIEASGERPRWLVCLSGGKDSYTLLAVLMDLKWRGLLPVDLLACNLDQGSNDGLGCTTRRERRRRRWWRW